MGFEPTVDYSTAVFKTAALNHSTTPPGKSRALKDCPIKDFFKLKIELIQLFSTFDTISAVILLEKFIGSGIGLPSVKSA